MRGMPSWYAIKRLRLTIGRLKCALSHSIWEGDRNHNNHRAQSKKLACLPLRHLFAQQSGCRNEATKEPLRTKKGRTASLWNERRWNESHETPEKGTTSIAWRRQSEIYFCLRLTMIVISKNLQPSMTDENLKEINEKTGISIKFFHHVHGKCEPQIAIAANGGPKQFSKLNFRCLHSQRFFSSAQREHF